MYAFITWIAFIWFFVLFCDTIFKTCMFHPYFRALQMTGLDIKPLMAYLRITRYNRLINGMGQWRPVLLQRWFDIGAFITCLIIGPSLLLYFVTLYQMLKSTSIEEYDGSVLLPVIPGYNFPLSHWKYYITIILVCSAVHEFGHALAASRERISIEDWGFALFAVFPLAFVHLRFDQFRQISLWQQLRILCAGIWHNIILSLLAFILWSSIFILLSPLYYSGTGITVLGIHQQSGLNHPAGFEIGDHVYSIGKCNVLDKESWRKCLRELSENPQQGFCIPTDQNIGSLDSKASEACLNSSGHLYFQSKVSKVFEDTHFPIEDANDNNEGICLNARQVVQNFDICDQTTDCREGSCFFPKLQSEFHRFVVIERHHKQPVLYAGSLNELAVDVQISELVKKYRLFPVDFGEVIITLLEYIIMFSSGLACLNILPILSLDGQFIIENLLHFCLQSYVPRFEHRRSIFIIINRLSLGLVICLMLITVYKFYMFF